MHNVDHILIFAIVRCSCLVILSRVFILLKRVCALFSHKSKQGVWPKEQNQNASIFIGQACRTTSLEYHHVHFQGRKEFGSVSSDCFFFSADIYPPACYSFEILIAYLKKVCPEQQPMSRPHLPTLEWAGRHKKMPPFEINNPTSSHFTGSLAKVSGPQFLLSTQRMTIDLLRYDVKMLFLKSKPDEFMFFT